MLPTHRHYKPDGVKEVKGDFPVYFHYTSGISGEKFFTGLRDKKLIANTCGSCSMTYLPPKMFCEDCFDELGDDTYKEVASTGVLFSFTEVFVDHRGDRLSQPYFLALIKIDGTSTMFYHRLEGIEKPEIGMKVKAIWNDTLSASIMDIKGFGSA